MEMSKTTAVQSFFLLPRSLCLCHFTCCYIPIISLFCWLQANNIDNRVAKCDFTNIKISELMGFVEIIWTYKTKNVHILAKNQHVGTISHWVITTVMLQRLHTNPSKNGLVLNVRNQANLKRICMRLSVNNHGNKNYVITVLTIILSELLNNVWKLDIFLFIRHLEPLGFQPVILDMNNYNGPTQEKAKSSKSQLWLIKVPHNVGITFFFYFFFNFFFFFFLFFLFIFFIFM